MAQQNERPRSTRTAVAAVCVTLLGVAISAISLMDQASAPSNSEPTSPTNINSQMSGIQAGNDVNVQGNVNINHGEEIPDQRLTINYDLYSFNRDVYEASDQPSTSLYCTGSLASIDNSTEHDIPLMIGELESDAGTADIGIVRANSNLQYVMPEYTGDFLIYNKDDENVFFVFSIIDC